MAAAGTDQSKIKKALRQLLKLPENKYCADCPIKGPTWASINLGVFVCLECSGIHRHMGVHISQVRSTELDTWKKEWYSVMKKMGNEKANEYWEANLPDDYSGKPSQAEAQALSYKLKKFITDKYEKKLWVKGSSSSTVSKSSKTKKKVESSSSDSSSDDDSSSESSSSSSEEDKKKKKKKAASQKKLNTKSGITKAKSDISKPALASHPEPELDLFGDFVGSNEVEEVGNQYANMSVNTPQAQAVQAPKPGIDLSSLYGQGSGSGVTYGRTVQPGQYQQPSGQQQQNYSHNGNSLSMTSGNYSQPLQSQGMNPSHQQGMQQGMNAQQQPRQQQQGMNPQQQPRQQQQGTNPHQQSMQYQLGMQYQHGMQPQQGTQQQNMYASGYGNQQGYSTGSSQQPQMLNTQSANQGQAYHYQNSMMQQKQTMGMGGNQQFNGMYTGSQPMQNSQQSINTPVQMSNMQQQQYPVPSAPVMQSNINHAPDKPASANDDPFSFF